MGNSLDSISSSERLSVEELAESAVRGVHRAMAARGGKASAIDWPGSVTVGVMIEPSVGTGNISGVQPEDTPDLGPLQTNAPIGRESIGRLNDLLLESQSNSMSFVQSLRADLPGTMSEIFDLTTAQKKKIALFNRNHPETASQVGDTLLAVLNQNKNTELEVDILGPVAMSKKKKDGDDDVKIKFEIKIEGTTEKEGKISAGLTFEF